MFTDLNYEKYDKTDTIILTISVITTKMSSYKIKIKEPKKEKEKPPCY
jgi:hypothetical protein